MHNHTKKSAPVIQSAEIFFTFYKLAETAPFIPITSSEVMI